MGQKKYFLTWDFRILRQHPVNKTVYCSKLSAHLPTDVLALDVPEGDTVINNSFIPQGEKESVYWVSDIKFTFNTEMRVWNLQNKTGLYLCFDSESLSFSREQPSFWEGFLSFTQEEISKIVHLLNNKWLLPKNQTVVDGRNFKFVDVFKIEVGDYDIDMRYQLPKYWEDYKMTLYFDGWKRENIYLYNPAIYITAYNKLSVMQQFKMCVISIRDFGKFTGPIIVMTDKDKAYIDNLFSHNKKYTDKLFIHNLYPKDFLSFVCSKYEIKDQKVFENYQPLLYLDPDIIIDSPVEKLLVRGAATGKICSPAEEFHPVHSYVSVGASLFSMDDIPSRFTPGINGGTILFPNIKDEQIRRFLDEIRHLVTNLGYKFGREFNLWADQEAYNYLAVKTDWVNSSALTPFTAYQGPAYDRRLGLVHFWGYSSEEKVERMQDYMKALGSSE